MTQVCQWPKHKNCPHKVVAWVGLPSSKHSIPVCSDGFDEYLESRRKTKA